MSEPEEDEFSERLDWDLWKRIFRRALSYQRRVIPLAISAVGIALVEACFALVTRWTVDGVRDGSLGGDFRWPIVAYLGLTVGLSLGVWIFIRAAGGLSNHMSHDIRKECFRRLQELEFAYFDHRPLGWLISRLTSDCDKLSRIIAWGTLDIVWAFCLVSVVTVILLVLDPVLGLAVLGVIPALVVVSAVFQKKLLLSSRETRMFNSKITASFAEALQGLKTTKSLGREEQNLLDFQGLSSGMFRVSLQNATQSAIYLPIVLTLGSVAAGMALWLGGGNVLAGTMSLGTLMAFIFYAGLFFHPINNIAEVLVQMQGAQAAGERVMSLLATEPRIQDGEDVRQRLLKWKDRKREEGVAPDGKESTIRELEFREVDFSYEDGETVLEGFNLKVAGGETVALVGSSGGGKSTIVNLASRFYEPTGGEILVNGEDYRKRGLAWYQSNLGIVLQGPHLFSGTIRENIRYGRSDASDTEVEMAAKAVNADKFIREMEEGYETEVGEGGDRLSTGEKQLISFARALLSDPQIFIMDEATSSIDTETEQLIQDGLKRIFEGRINFVIAHRLSTIRNADRILVIHKGKILESGTHRELLAKRGHYHSLYTRQFGRQEPVGGES